MLEPGLGRIISRLIEAQRELDEKEESYEGHSGAWALAPWRERVEIAEKDLNDYIARIELERRERGVTKA